MALTFARIPFDGTRRALYSGMAFITIWRRGVLECVLVLNGKAILLRLSDGISVLQEISVTSTDEALRAAEVWEVEARRNAVATTLAALAAPPGVHSQSGDMRAH